MLTIPKLLRVSRETPVDFQFIKKLSSIGNRIRMVDHERGINKKTTLKKIFGTAQCVAILFHLIRDNRVTPIGHWCLLIKGARGKPIKFFDSLGLGLTRIYKLTQEVPYLLKMLQGKRWENSNQKLQTQGQHFKECGCFVGMRARLAHLSNKEFVRFIRSGPGKSDDTVVMLALLEYLQYYHKNVLQ